MNLRRALIPLLMGLGEPATGTPSSSSSSRDVSSSSASSSAADYHDNRVSIDVDAYGIKRKRNAIQARKKLHQLHDPSPSSELTNRHDHRINGDSSTRSDGSKKQDIGYLDHRHLSEDRHSDETSQRQRELESREKYCDDLCPSGRPVIEANGGDFKVLIKSSDSNEQIGCWNTSAVTDMYEAFYNMRSFNQNINCWDVARVTTMGSMFLGARIFDKPLDDWNVASLTDMPYMFSEATVFNQPINDWNVAKVTSMERTFYNAESFDQPLDDWDVARVTKMSKMFYYAEVFNQPVDDWNVAKVNDMRWMFYYAEDFNQCILSWAEKTSSTVDIREMFINSNCAVKTISSSNFGPWCRDYDCVPATSAPTTSLAPTSALSLAPTSALSLAPTSAPTTTPTERPTGSPSASPAGACDKSAEFNCDKHSAGFKKRKCSKKIRKKWGVGLKFKDVCPHMCRKELCTCVDRVEKFSIKGIDGDHTCAGLIDTTNCKKFTDNGFGVNKICPNRCQNTKKCIN